MKRLALGLALGVVALLSCGGLAEAGRLYGPRIDFRRAPAYSTVTYTETFVGGQVARVSIVGDGTTDLDLYVYDEYGYLVVRATGLSDIESVLWVPARTGTYRIEVRNLGVVYNNYLLTTN
jgi:hypothetical protein